MTTTLISRARFVQKMKLQATARTLEKEKAVGGPLMAQALATDWTLVPGRDGQTFLLLAPTALAAASWRDFLSSHSVRSDLDIILGQAYDAIVHARDTLLHKLPLSAGVNIRTDKDTDRQEYAHFVLTVV